MYDCQEKKRKRVTMCERSIDRDIYLNEGEIMLEREREPCLRRRSDMTHTRASARFVFFEHASPMACVEDLAKRAERKDVDMFTYCEL